MGSDMLQVLWVDGFVAAGRNLVCRLWSLRSSGLTVQEFTMYIYSYQQGTVKLYISNRAPDDETKGLKHIVLIYLHSCVSRLLVDLWEINAVENVLLYNCAVLLWNLLLGGNPIAVNKYHIINLFRFKQGNIFLTLCIQLCWAYFVTLGSSFSFFGKPLH
jgi:hypothetical protein